MGFNCLKTAATSRRQFTFYHQVPRNSCYSFYRPWKDERLSQPWSHPMVLSMGPLNWESSALTTRPLLHKAQYHSGFKVITFHSNRTLVPHWTGSRNLFWKWVLQKQCSLKLTIGSLKTLTRLNYKKHLIQGFVKIEFWLLLIIVYTNNEFTNV